MQTIVGKIIKFLPKVEGESSRGPWVKGGFVIEYGDEYPTKAAFTIFGEQRLQKCAELKEGMEVTVNYNPQSREYNDRWYTDMQCFSVFPVQQVPQQPAQPAPQQQADLAQYPYTQQYAQQAQPAPVFATMEEDNTLPF